MNLNLKNYIFLIILSILGSHFLEDIQSEEFFLLKENQVINKSINWETLPIKQTKKKLIWQKLEESEYKKNYKFAKSKNKNNFKIRSLGRSITLNSNFYPEISNYVPNAFVQDQNKFITTHLRGISKTRHCKKNNFSYRCMDGVFEADLNIINSDKFSFNTKVNVQSLSNRSGGTVFGEGISLGFKAAKEISEKWSLAFGGENIIHFDNSIDLGRNFYLVASTYYPFSRNDFPNKPILFINTGVGTDFYGYGGNGFLGKVPCLGRPNLTGGGTSDCQLGPITSLSLALNNRISLNSEWFGYGYGSGISFRPFRESNLTASIYATDFINDFPKYINSHCPNKKCQTRFYGSLSYSF